MVTLEQVEKATKAYADERNTLTELVQALNDDIEALKRKRLAEIRKAVNRTAEKKSALTALIEEGEELFVKPKSLVFSGIKVGYRKGKGKLEWEDDEQVVKLIKKHFLEQSDVLIKTTEKPIEAALKELDAKDLMKLGVTAEDTGDVPFAKPTDSGVDKLVKAFLKDAEKEGD